MKIANAVFLLATLSGAAAAYETPYLRASFLAGHEDSDSSSSSNDDCKDIKKEKDCIKGNKCAWVNGKCDKKPKKGELDFVFNHHSSDDSKSKSKSSSSSEDKQRTRSDRCAEVKSKTKCDDKNQCAWVNGKCEKAKKGGASFLAGHEDSDSSSSSSSSNDEECKDLNKQDKCERENKCAWVDGKCEKAKKGELDFVFKDDSSDDSKSKPSSSSSSSEDKQRTRSDRCAEVLSKPKCVGKNICAWVNGKCEKAKKVEVDFATALA